MPYDRFLIAPFQTGYQTNLRPFLIPEDAFAQLNNAYVFRGRVRKRFGSRYMGSSDTPLTAPLLSRFRIQVATTDGAGNATGTVPGSIFKIGQAFSIGTEIFTVHVTGTPGVMLTTGASTVHTYNTTTGAYVINGAAHNTAVYFYPAEPVMGLTIYEKGPIDNEPTYGFDTQFAYTFSTSWQRSVNTATPAPVWHGNNLNFFWTTTWDGSTPDIATMYVTNFNAHIGTAQATDDAIWSFNNIGANPWSPFSYAYDATFTVNNPGNVQPLTVTQTTAANNQIIQNYVQSARIIVAFKNRLLLLNTIENNANGATAFNPGSPTTTGITPTNYLTSTNTAFVNRCRFSHNGSPLSTNAWLEPNFTYNPGATGTVNADGGGFIDAATEESIVSAEFIKDRLIVYFECSTWELVYTGINNFPFAWQKINTELGSEAQQSTVPFDKIVLTMGSTGVHACNGANVERIDNKIPDQVFQIINKNVGVQRVAGIRDYFVEMVYWSFPSTNKLNTTATYPTQVLVYNYENDSWAINDDCITSFGYFEQQTDILWDSTTSTWAQYNAQWNSGINQAQFRQVIAGNQQGYVFIVHAEISRNEAVMQISNLTASVGGFATMTIVDHTLDNGDYISIENAQGINPNIVGIYQVVAIVDKDNIVVDAFDIVGTYTGGGVSARISNINILSKQWNPYLNQARNVYLSKIDFGVVRTAAGQITVDYFPSASEFSMVEAGDLSGAILGNNILETFPYPTVPFESLQQRLWHPVYFQTEGECIQINLLFSNEQMRRQAVVWDNFELDGMVLYTMAVSTRLQ